MSARQMSQSQRSTRRTRRPKPPVRRAGRPHLVALPGGKDAPRGKGKSRSGKTAPKQTRSPKRRRSDRMVARVASAFFIPLSSPLSSSGVRFVATASAVLMAFIFGLVMLHILSAQASFRLEGLHERVEREEARYRKMRYEVASAESPARIADAARGLGMVPPAQRRYIVGPPGEPSENQSTRKVAGGGGGDEVEMKALLSGSYASSLGSHASSPHGSGGG